MDAKDVSWVLVVLVLIPVITSAWRSREVDRVRRDPEEPRELRRGVHYHNKRQMPVTEPETRKRIIATAKPKREGRRKTSGHMPPIEDDYMDNDEVVSVAIGPKLRPKFEKGLKKPFPTPKTFVDQPTPSINVITFVKDVLTEITKDFLTRNVNENFVFGQYVGNAMKNLTNELRINMQHEILELIVKYQKINNGDVKKEERKQDILKDKVRKDKTGRNSTDGADETWPDFTNLAGIA